MTAPLNKSPLLVFLLLGSGLFAGQRWLADADDERRVVTVTDEQVDALRARWDAQWGRPPTDRELQGLLDEMVREEILYREALRLGLDRGDPIVRRRLAEKMTFMLEDNAQLPAPTAHEVEAYYAAHAERYREPQRTTFRHVYLSGDRRADARRDAAALLQVVRDGEADDWRRAGDPFPLLREYTDRTGREIAELFGADFAAALSGLPAGAEDWHGPLDSAHGTHLVQVLDRNAPRTPALDDVRERIVPDLLAAQRRDRNRIALRALRERYDVRMPAAEPPGKRP